MRRIFPSLTLIPGISFEIGQVAKRPERRAFDKAIARYRAADLEGQAGQLTEAFDGLHALRMLFGSSTGPGDCCRLETIVPARYLAELLVAVPVRFIEAKGQPVRDGAWRPQSSGALLLRPRADRPVRLPLPAL